MTPFRRVAGGLILASMVLVHVGFAQTGQDVSDGFQLRPGLLRVTFGPEVSLRSATQFSKQEGFVVYGTSFDPITVWTGSQERFSESELQTIRERPEVLHIRQEDIMTGLVQAAEADSSINVRRLLQADDFYPFNIIFSMSPDLSEQHAKVLAESFGLNVLYLSKHSNDLILKTLEGEEPEAAALLEESNLVDSVAYFKPGREP